jgi:hypothetical protein
MKYLRVSFIMQQGGRHVVWETFHPVVLRQSVFSPQRRQIDDRPSERVLGPLRALAVSHSDTAEPFLGTACARVARCVRLVCLEVHCRPDVPSRWSK